MVEEEMGRVWYAEDIAEQLNQLQKWAYLVFLIR
jgi:hypothetical protein